MDGRGTPRPYGWSIFREESGDLFDTSISVKYVVIMLIVILVGCTPQPKPYQPTVLNFQHLSKGHCHDLLVLRDNTTICSIGNPYGTPIYHNLTDEQRRLVNDWFLRYERFKW
jgi:hypothetical protein